MEGSLCLTDRAEKDADENVPDIQNDVSQLADTLEDVPNHGK